MKFELKTLENKDINKFKLDIQEAFQKGYEDEFGKSCFQILPENDINKSLETKGSVVYKAVINDDVVGGAIIATDKNKAHIDFICEIWFAKPRYRKKNN